MLETIGAQLHKTGRTPLAESLVKFQQDVGVKIVGGADATAEGPESAVVVSAYEPITPRRLAILQDVYHALDDASLKEKLATLIKTLPVLPAQDLPPAKPTGPKPRRLPGL